MILVLAKRYICSHPKYYQRTSCPPKTLDCLRSLKDRPPCHFCLLAHMAVVPCRLWICEERLVPSVSCARILLSRQVSATALDGAGDGQKCLVCMNFSSPIEVACTASIECVGKCLLIIVNSLVVGKWHASVVGEDTSNRAAIGTCAYIAAVVRLCRVGHNASRC